MLVEKGFRFLKDKSFRVAEVYLKSEKRIEALCMIMVLCLMVYSYTEMLLRKRLKEEDETVLNHKKKPTSNPTLKWIFFKFRESKSCHPITWGNNNYQWYYCPRQRLKNHFSGLKNGQVHKFKTQTFIRYSI